MSDELEKLRRQMEQATAPEVPPDAGLDAETESLRRTWLALGQLLEASQPAADRPLELRPMPRRTGHLGRKLAAAATLAASLALGVVVAWALIERAQTDGPASPARKVASPESPQEAELPTDTGPSPVQEQPLPQTVDRDETIRLAWDDSLDDRIAEMGQEVARAQQDWDGLDDTLGTVWQGLEEIEEDIQNDTL